MYIYYVRWSIYSNEKLYLVGAGEYKRKDFISHIEHIMEIKAQICHELMQKRIPIASGEVVMVDFYSLLRKE